MKRFLFLIITFFLFNASNGLAQKIEIANDVIRKDVDRATRALLDSMFNAFEMKNADRGNGYYHQGEHVLHVSNTGIVMTDTVLAYTKKALNRLKSLKISWKPIDLKVLTEDIAIRVIEVTFRTERYANEFAESIGIQTFVFRKIGTEWKVIHDQRILVPKE